MATGILNRGMTQSDERTKLESDVVTGIEAVKTQAWETFFSERVTELRARELDILWEGFKLSALNTLILQTIPTLVTIATFSLYVILGNTLTATKAFTALSLFSVLRFPLFQLPMVVSFVTRAQVALGRLKVRLLFALPARHPAQHPDRWSALLKRASYVCRSLCAARSGTRRTRSPRRPQAASLCTCVAPSRGRARRRRCCTTWTSWRRRATSW